MAKGFLRLKSRPLGLLSLLRDLLEDLRWKAELPAEHLLQGVLRPLLLEGEHAGEQDVPLTP